MNQMVRFGLILAMICLIASGVLAVTYKVTKPAIEMRAKEEEKAALEAILPEADDFVEKQVNGIGYYEGYKEKRLIGYCVKAVGNGYGGYFHIMVGVDPMGTIHGVEILDHQETPGLGARIDEVKPGEKDAWFLRQFKGKSALTISIKDIDAITGATISSKAVVDSVTTAIREFLEKVKK
jgi:electron transport complex protein RnfG